MNKKQKLIMMQPFGIEMAPFLEQISTEYTMQNSCHALHNYISGVDNSNNVIYQHAERKWSLTSTSGLFAKFKGDNNDIYISGMHTEHTESIYKMAHALKTALRLQQPVVMSNNVCSDFKHVNMSNARRQERHKTSNVVYMSAVHQQRQVVLKTTTDNATQLKYIVEALIHHRVSTLYPNYLAKLHFVAFRGDALVVCMDQLQQTSVCSFLTTLHQTVRNPDIAVFHMVKSFCIAIRNLQKYAGFTHRDCHTGNVFYDETEQRIKMIDFDWSCIMWNDKTISVPRFLYDTTRQNYGKNKSVDCCVFFRTLGFSLNHCPHFKKVIYEPLMARYEQDCKNTLMKNFAEGDVAAKQLYIMSTENGKVSGNYAHRFGTTNKQFDYKMGYYTYVSMTPSEILKFLDNSNFF